jgi:hypothetical protein
MPRRRWPGRRWCWTTCRATRTAWPCPTSASSASTPTGVRLRVRADDQRRQAHDPHRRAEFVATLPAACAAAGLQAHPALRAAQPGAQGPRPTSKPARMPPPSSSAWPASTSPAARTAGWANGAPSRYCRPNAPMRMATSPTAMGRHCDRRRAHPLASALPASCSTAPDLLAPAALIDRLVDHRNRRQRRHSRLPQPQRPIPVMSPLPAAPAFALPHWPAEPYIPQQPRTPPPWRRFSPTRFIRRHQHQCVRPASLGRICRHLLRA